MYLNYTSKLLLLMQVFRFNAIKCCSKMCNLNSAMCMKSLAEMELCVCVFFFLFFFFFVNTPIYIYDAGITAAKQMMAKAWVSNSIHIG